MKKHISYYIIFFVMMFFCSCKTKEDQYREWRVYQGDPGSNSYSLLDQINTANVHRLEVAWTFHTGDKDNILWRSSTSECNPIVVNGIMYLTSPALKVMAINAETGVLKWSFDPFFGEKATGVNRGVAYWEKGNDKRIFSSAGSKLFAVNAETGDLISEFGEKGFVDLRLGLERDTSKLYVVATSPGTVYKDLLIMGSTVGEHEGAAPGHVRAYDVRTGAIEWIFHTIPQPGEYGYDTWENPEAWKTFGGANAWGGLSLDEKRGIVFAPTGSPSSDFYGGNRKGQNLYGNCVLALNASTGERIWHYQTLHHDLWDYDLPCPPNLVTVTHNGKKTDAVAQVTKQGFVFVLNRETGEPLFPIEERPVPASLIEGEAAWLTQPFPLKPPAFARQHLTEDILTDISPEAREYALAHFKELKSEGLYTPVSEQKTVFFPGTQGGAVWGGAAFDPQSGLLYINSNEFPYYFSLKKVEIQDQTNTPPSGKKVYEASCAACHGEDRKGTSGLFPSLVKIQHKLSRDGMKTLIRKGRGSMPGFPNLSDEEVNALINYISEIPEAGNPDTKVVPEVQMQKRYRYVHTGYNQFTDHEGYPGVKPPWGTLNAINLNTGEIAWQVPLGEFKELTARGIPPTGTRSLGGPIVTAGGLVFIAGTLDEKFRAFDKMTGKVLWETSLPAGGYATPCTYEIDGRQYVVIAATGGGRIGTKTGDTFVAFALPEFRK